MSLLILVRFVVVEVICCIVVVSAFDTSWISVCFAWSVLDTFRKSHLCSRSLVSGSVVVSSFLPMVIASSSVKEEWHSFTVRKPIVHIIDAVFLGILSLNNAVRSTFASVSVM